MTLNLKLKRGVEYIVPLREGDTSWINILSTTFVKVS